MGFMGGVKADFNILPIMKKRLKITGSTLRPRDNQFKSEIAANLLKNVWPLLADGTINPVIDKIFPLEDIIDAHTYLERGEHFGKVILKI